MFLLTVITNFEFRMVNKVAISLIVAILFGTPAVMSQDYKIKVTQPDSFSVAFVKLLSSGTDFFKDYKGDLINSNSLEGDQYLLTLQIPGSSASIVQYRDNDKNAYVEFGNYADIESLEKGLMELIGKIKVALGDQLHVDHELLRGPESKFFLSSFGIRDSTGYFEPNIELMSASSMESRLRRPVYTPNGGLQSPYFIIMKLTGGWPVHYSWVLPAKPVDESLDKVLQYLIGHASNDFENLYDSKSKGKKGVDTFMMNGYMVIATLKGSNYSAEIILPPKVADYSFYNHSIQAAVGSGYVYRTFNVTPGQPARTFILYFPQHEDLRKPKVSIYESSSLNTITISSNYTHEVPRHLMHDE